MARESIRDSLRSHGEECILVHLLHAAEVQDDPAYPRCPACFDDIYSQGDKYDCGNCLGTTFAKGYKSANRAWGLFGDAVDKETFGKRGMYHPTARNIHTEAYPDLWDRDFVIRLTGWSIDHRPTGIEGIYVFSEVANETIRTGNHFGQTELHNVGQRGDLQRVASDMPISRLPVIGQVFSRVDGRER